MDPSAFDEENGVLSPPQGVSETEVCSLSVFRKDGIVISCWKPSKDELDEITKTGRLWLMIWGPSMPPACVIGFSPFKLWPNLTEKE